MSEKIDRRKFLAGAGAGSLVLVSLGGCGSSQVRQPGTPHYGMVFDQNKCVGCRDCRIACNETNKLPKGVTRLLLELQDDKIEGKRGYAADRRYVRVSCQQCSDAAVRDESARRALRPSRPGDRHRDDGRFPTSASAASTASPAARTTRVSSTRRRRPPTTATSACTRELAMGRAAGLRGSLPATTRWCSVTSNDPNSYISKLLAVKDSVRVRAVLGTEPSLRYIPIVKARRCDMQTSDIAIELYDSV